MDEENLKELQTDLTNLGFVKPNCYECKFRQELGWSAHSKCVGWKKNEDEHFSYHAMVELALATGQIKLDGVKFHQHGIDNGWAQWPNNFDPCWLLECKFFEKK
jgi:hypothetical protein